MGVCRKAVRLDNVEEIGEKIFYLFFRSTTKVCRRSKGVDGACLERYRLGVRDCVLENICNLIVDCVRVKSDDGNTKCYVNVLAWLK